MRIVDIWLVLSLVLNSIILQCLNILQGPPNFTSARYGTYHLFLNRRQMANQESAANFTNILQAAFAQMYFCQKVTNLNCKWRKTAQCTFI